MSVARFVALALFAVALPISQSWAADAPGAYLYQIAGNDGYGLEECLDGASDCGQLVADELCDAQGHGKALSYGLPSRFDTANSHIASAPGGYVVACGE